MPIDVIPRLDDPSKNLMFFCMPSNHFNATWVIILNMVFVLSSCDKAQKMDAERAKLVAERQVILDEIAVHDNQAAALNKNGLSGDAIEIGRSSEAVLQQTADAEKKASQMLQQWSEIETKFNVLRDKANAYKAKNLR